MTRRSTSPDPAVDVEPDEFEEGRTFPFATVGDWVAMSGASHTACRVYWIYRMHVNRKREREAGNSDAWPTLKTVCEILNVKKTDTISNANAELVALQAIDIETVATPEGRRNRYTVHLAPPPGYAGFTSLDEFYAARKARLKAEKAAAAAERNSRSDKVPRSSGVPTDEPRNSRSDRVTRSSGVPGVPRSSGVGVPRSSGVPVTRSSGVKPQEEQPQELNQGRGRVRRPAAPAPAAAPRNAPSPEEHLPEIDDDDPATWRCRRHRGLPVDVDEGPCGPCGRVRESAQARVRKRRSEGQAEGQSAAAQAVALEHAGRACRMCGPDGQLPDGAGTRWVRRVPGTGRFAVPYVRCDHVTPHELVDTEQAPAVGASVSVGAGV